MLASELHLLFRRRRTWALFAALAAVPVLIGLAVRVSAGPPRGRGPAFLDQVAGNGLFLAVVGLLVSVPLFLPLTVAVVAGDSIAGEASQGTLRYLLTAPVSRAGLLLVKYAVIVVFCAAAVLVLAGAGVLVGLVLFGVQPAVLLSGDTLGLGASYARIALIAAYVAVSLLGLGAIGLFLSTLSDVPVGVMAAIAVLAVAAQIAGSLPQLDWLHPWLFTEHWTGFVDLLRQPVLWDSFVDNSVLQAGYVLVFGALAYGRFATKDVLS
ncbi:ABC transporter permease [Micrococcus sp. TA1]|uniref:ABC transporter permease n=1 Tax=Micrococcus sp. TA1 TaxID=681627 RepID=UPI0016157443|nr:ABC transporter permease [Micrococcus sp. TA1]